MSQTAALATGSSSAGGPQVSCGPLDGNHETKKQTQQRRNNRWGLSRGTGKNGSSVASTEVGSSNIADTNGTASVIEYRRNIDIGMSSSALTLDSGMPTTAMPDIPSVPDILPPPLALHTSSAMQSIASQNRNQNNPSSKGSVSGTSGDRSLTNSRQRALLSPDRNRHRATVATSNSLQRQPQHQHHNHPDQPTQTSFLPPAPLMDNSGPSTTKNDSLIDDGRHNSRDFENMVIECDDRSSSSFGDITYDGSIIEDDYYRNRHSNNQHRPMPRPITNNNTTSTSLMRLEKRAATGNIGYSYNHKNPPARYSEHNQIPPRSPSSKVKSSLRQRMAQNSASNTNNAVNVIDEQLYEQEMALIELAMERSMKDSSSAASSRVSRTTHRTYTSTGSSNSGIEGAGCHLQMIASNNGKADSLQNIRAGQIVQTESGARFLWKREGKKWLKVPLGSTSSTTSNGIDESNLDAIAEEKEPPLRSRSGSYHRSNEHDKYASLNHPPLSRTSSEPYNTTQNSRVPESSSTYDFTSNFPSGYFGDMKQIGPGALSQLDPDRLDRIEQELIDQALLRSIECMHSSQSSSALSSIHMSSPFRSPRYITPPGGVASISNSHQQSPATFGGVGNVEYHGNHQPPARSASWSNIAPPLYSNNDDYKSGSDVDYPNNSDNFDNREYNTMLERSAHDQSISSLVSSGSSRSGRSTVSGRSGTPLSHKIEPQNNSGGISINSGGGHSGSTTGKPPRPIPPQYARHNNENSIERLGSAGCHLAMIGARKPSTRAILTGIDYEEDEEELMAEHLQPQSNHYAQRRVSLGSRHSSSSERRPGDSAGYSQNGVKLVWKRGPNNRWGKFPEFEDNNANEEVLYDIDAEEERMVREALARSLLE